MRIVNTCIRYPPALGGAEDYVKFISEGMAERGHKVTVYTTDLKDHSTGEKLYSGKEIMNGVRVIRLKSFMPPKLGYPIIPSLPFHLMREKTDIINAHGIYYFTADVSAIIAKIRRIPYVLKPWFFNVNKRLLGLDMEKAYLGTLGKLQLNAEATVLATEFERRVIEDKGFKIKHPFFIPPAVDIERFKEAGPNIYKKYGVSDRRILLFVGRIDKGKGLDLLVKVAPLIVKKHPDVLFAIAGSDFGFLREMRSEIKRLNMEDYFLFTGTLRGRNLISAYKNASLFVFPSRYECFGIVLIEAMASGLPVVASDSTAIPYVIKNRRTGLLFRGEDVSDFYNKIIELLRNRSLYNAIRRNQLSDSKRYAKKRILDEIEKLYLSRIKRKNA